MNTLPLFFISNQKQLGKGPEIIPHLEAWLPVLRASLETALPLPPAASGGAPESDAEHFIPSGAGLIVPAMGTMGSEE